MDGGTTPAATGLVEPFQFALKTTGLSVGAHYLFDWLSLREGSLAVSGLAALGSLAALGWPVLRGIPWRQVRRDIGWHAGTDDGADGYLYIKRAL